MTIERIAVFVAVLALSRGHSQSMPSPLNQLQSGEDNVRMAAFYELLNQKPTERFNVGLATLRFLRDHPSERSMVVLSLVDLLKRENVRVQRPFGEEFSNYYGDLIWCVATLRDVRAADALLGAVQTGNLATDGLAALGQDALPTILPALSAPDVGMRYGVLRVLEKMAAPSAQSSAGAARRAQVRAALLRGIEDQDSFNRRVAVRALESFPDDDVRRAVQGRFALDISPEVRNAAEDWLRKNPSH